MDDFSACTYRVNIVCKCSVYYIYCAMYMFTVVVFKRSNVETAGPDKSRSKDAENNIVLD